MQSRIDINICINVLFMYMNENPQKFNPMDGAMENDKPILSETNSNPEKFNPIPTEQELVDRGEIVLDPLEQAKKIAKNELEIENTKAKIDKLLSGAVVMEDGNFVPQEKPIENNEVNNEIPVPKPPEKKFDPMDGAMENGSPIIKEKFNIMDGATEDGKSL